MSKRFIRGDWEKQCGHCYALFQPLPLVASPDVTLEARDAMDGDDGKAFRREKAVLPAC